MSINSNRKGKRYERQACKMLESLDYKMCGLNEPIEARRSQQYQGVQSEDDSADIQTNIPHLRFEVKGGYNDFNLTSAPVKKWIKTSMDETPPDQVAAILWKKSHMDWIIMFPTDEENCIVYTDIEYGLCLHTPND